jgi:hypothetical protein
MTNSLGHIEQDLSLQGAFNLPYRGDILRIVCPSVCPSHWDKRKTLTVNHCITAAYGERSKT